MGSLREPAAIEIHDMHSGTIVCTLKNGHTDMIDSMLKINLAPEITQVRTKKIAQVQWLVSAGRDRKLILWKLLDGQNLRRVSQNNLKS